MKIEHKLVTSIDRITQAILCKSSELVDEDIQLVKLNYNKELYYLYGNKSNYRWFSDELSQWVKVV